MTSAEILLSLEMGLIYGIVALGIYLTFRVIDFCDMTCDGSFVLGATISAVSVKNGINPVIGAALGFLGGGSAGLLTGLLHTRLRVSKLLAGILVAFMLYSVNLKVMGGVPNITLIDEQTLFSDLPPLLVLAVISTVLWLTGSYLLVTDAGLALRSVGQNPTLAHSLGVGVSGLTLLGLSVSNGLIGLGGALFAQHQGFADATQGVGTVIIALGAVLIGEKLLPFRSPWLVVLGCFLGSLVYRVLVALALHGDWLGLESQDLNLITGLLVILVMVIPQRRQVLCFS